MRPVLQVVARPWRVAAFVGLYAWDLLRANAVVAWEVLTPTNRTRPGIVACPVRSESDLELTALANLVSFTPGTLALEVAEDRSVIFVHALHMSSPDDVRRAVRRLEDRLRWMLR